MLIYYAVQDLAGLVIARIAKQNQFLNKPSWTLPQSSIPTGLLSGLVLIIRRSAEEGRSDKSTQP